MRPDHHEIALLYGVQHYLADGAWLGLTNGWSFGLPVSVSSSHFVVTWQSREGFERYAAAAEIAGAAEAVLRGALALASDVRVTDADGEAKGVA